MQSKQYTWNRSSVLFINSYMSGLSMIYSQMDCVLPVDTAVVPKPNSLAAETTTLCLNNRMHDVIVQKLILTHVYVVFTLSSILCVRRLYVLVSTSTKKGDITPIRVSQYSSTGLPPLSIGASHVTCRAVASTTSTWTLHG